jgi:PAP2 superfamily
VLVVRATLASPRTRVRVAWLAGWLLVVIAAARLVQTVHYVTDVVGGAALGLAVTGWVALAITAGCRHRPAHGGSIAPSGTTLHLPAGQDERLPRDSPGAN